MPLLADPRTIKLYKKLRALGGSWDKEAKGWQMPEAAMAEAQALLAALPPPKPQLDPRLKEAREAVEAAHLVLAALKRAERSLKAEIVLAVEPIVDRLCHACNGSGRRSPNNLLDDCNNCDGSGETTDVPEADDLQFSGWECETSPVGQCVYDDVGDPHHHRCIFCEEPATR